MHRSKEETCRNEIKSYITREGMTMTEVVELLADEYGWSSSVPNLSGKLRRGSLRYTEAVELADVLGYDLIWVKRQQVR
nr:LLM class flavin-dependent oxidoreductase [uncultured Oscillibacter sp.]